MIRVASSLFLKHPFGFTSRHYCCGGGSDWVGITYGDDIIGRKKKMVQCRCHAVRGGGRQPRTASSLCDVGDAVFVFVMAHHGGKNRSHGCGCFLFRYQTDP